MQWFLHILQKMFSSLTYLCLYRPMNSCHARPDRTMAICSGQAQCLVINITRAHQNVAIFCPVTVLLLRLLLILNADFWNLPVSPIYILTDGWRLYTPTHTCKNTPAAAAGIKVIFDRHCPQHGALCRHVPRPLQSHSKTHCGEIGGEKKWNMWPFAMQIQEPVVSWGPS